MLRDAHHDIAELAPSDGAARRETIERLEEPATELRAFVLAAREIRDGLPRRRSREMLEEPRAVLAKSRLGLGAKRCDERMTERLALPLARELEDGTVRVVVDALE